MASEETSSLDPTSPNRMGGGKERKMEREKKEERERSDSRERNSTFSLNFSAIGPTNSCKARSKVGIRYKGYAWAPVLRSFDELREVGVFFYVDIPCLKSHENGFGYGDAGNGQGFRFQRNGTDD